MTVLGIDVGGTKIAAALFRESGEILARHTTAIGQRAGREVGTLIRETAAQLLHSSTGRADPPRAIAAIVPGIYWSDGAKRGRVWAPNIRGWDDYPLLDELRTLGGEGVAVAVDSDRAGYILGEAWLGAAKGARDAIFVAVGTGIGAGILVNGQVLRGSRDIAGATGWMALDRPFRAGYREVGCFEYNASGPGIVRVAHDYMADEPEHESALRRLPEITTASVFEAAEVGDALAVRVVENAIAFWGMAVANYTSLFDPEIIVFGGGVFGPAARYIDQIRQEALLWGQPISTPRVRLAVSTLGGDAGLIGAGHLALRGLQG